MNKKIVALLIGVVVVAIGAFIAMKNTGANKPINTNLKVISFGDSLVVGQGSTLGHDFSSVLSQRLGITIINKGKNGETTTGGLARLQADVLDQKPDVVLLLLGGNDALQKVPIDQTFANLQEIITRIESTGAKVLLLGIQGGVIGDPYSGRFDQLAKKNNLPYVSNVLKGLWGDSRYMSDPIHPNDIGYAKIADRVEPELKKIVEN